MEVSAILAKMAERIRCEPEYSQPCSDALPKSSHRIITHNPGDTGVIGVKGLQMVRASNTVGVRYAPDLCCAHTNLEMRCAKFLLHLWLLHIFCWSKWLTKFFD
jgi:hypothetical protein